MYPSRHFYILPASLLIILATCSRHLTHAHTTSTEVGRPINKSTQDIRTNTTMFAWSAWGQWGRCSKTCGGGVAMQERHCLPRDPARIRRSRKRRKLVRSVEHMRQTRNVIRGPANEPDCPGLARRYHECNTAPCPGSQRDSRADQCAVYDRRPFRGRFYTWVPYVDGNAPCILNCRPRGQQFYASLALVSDGTACTKPGFRAICVQGACKVVGREGVLSSMTSRDMHCGTQLVSGLFSRPRLPLGYSYVTTVPRGACRLNISEVVSSENYIALKVSNGSYIMNGEFAVSAPGTYEAAGARFVYTRNGGLDSVFANGPIHQSVDIMILYTQPNPNIKYEFLSDSNHDDSNDIPLTNSVSSTPHHQAQRHHRHHNTEAHSKSLEKNDPTPSKNPEFNNLESQSQVQSNVIGNRKFAWKVLSFTQCSRSCGGGLQIGKYKCAELGEKEDKEISPAHCSGTAPPSRRRRCGAAPCPARWRAAAWGACPVCGPAHRTRIVGCVQDHARGITKISDQKCPLPVPPSSELCDIPNCDGTAVTATVPRLDSRRQVRPKDKTDTFREGPVISLTTNLTENDVIATPSPSYNFNGGDGWLYTEWSECAGWCVGGGVQSRGVRCVDPSGCTAKRAPEATQTCTVRKQCDAQWFMGDWSPCTADCGGRQIRGVICIGGNGRRLRDGSCRGPRPESERACGEKCSPSWYLSDWGECQGPCEAGVQSRTVWCARGGIDGASGAARDGECPGVRPVAKRICVPARCTTRPEIKPPVVNLVPSVSDPQQRVTRHQSRNPQSSRDRSYADGACADKLNNCVLAVQARLCHYPYYTDNCCNSCHGR